MDKKFQNALYWIYYTTLDAFWKRKKKKKGPGTRKTSRMDLATA